ncbi:alpha/beta hydrolase family protein [Jatrophihabitans sp. GAS493]|uniref:alpha/beta hydrolase n=1 Tax=Jatrophihabitans sp. GAS493 TaxID=1907575 RepID=UPI0012FD9D55|nr:alpha/beta hydrolase family protein [Jatrophihabitans sp. GAS493]
MEISSDSKSIRKAGRSRRRRILIPAAVAVTLALAVIPQTAAGALGCGFLGLSNCAPKAPTGAPGTSVAQLSQVNQSGNGGTNPKLGAVPSTSKIGVPNAGVVPIVGLNSARADDGAFVAYESRVDARTVDLMVYSPALNGPAPVRLMLPADWSTQPSSTWPSVYLLHGGNDKTDYQSWSLFTKLPQETAATDALFVLPSIGSSAFATNYWNYGISGQGNQYDTFVATELPQLLQRGYRANSKAVVAGISSGGYSALALAALHPATFAAAASYSGLDDLSSVTTGLIIEAGNLIDLKSPVAMWGDYLLQNSIWRAHDPAALLANLRNTPVFVSAGNGKVGPLDPSGASSDSIEPVVLGTSQSFAQKAQSAGVPVTSDFYGNGTHSWFYWDREFVRSWPMFAAAAGISGSLTGVSP